MEDGRDKFAGEGKVLVARDRMHSQYVKELDAILSKDTRIAAAKREVAIAEGKLIDIIAELKESLKYDEAVTQAKKAHDDHMDWAIRGSD